MVNVKVKEKVKLTNMDRVKIISYWVKDYLVSPSHSNYLWLKSKVRVLYSVKYM